MESQARLAWMAVLAALLGVVVLALIWAAAPEDVRGALMLFGGVLTLLVYVALYAIQRRHHWRS